MVFQVSNELIKTICKKCIWVLQFYVLLVDDLDGEPIDEDPPHKKKRTTGAFVPSKWETVDPEQIEAQAMTTSKWDTLEPAQHVNKIVAFCCYN